VTAPDKVSDVFAFVAKHAEFTTGILFAKDEVPEIRPEEREAIGAVIGHVQASYVALLSRCRDDILARAQGDDAFVATIERNWNRDDSLWDRGRVDVPLLIEASYVDVAYFWIDQESHRPGVLNLVGEIWTQARRRDALRRVAAQCKEPLFMSSTGNLRMLAPELKEGALFADLSRTLVDALWPRLVDIRTALMKKE